MKRVVGLVVGVFLSVFLIAAVQAGPKGAAVIKGDESNVQKPEQATQSDESMPNDKLMQGTQSGQLTPDEKAKLSKRNQAKIEQAEAAKIKRDFIEKSNPDTAK